MTDNLAALRETIAAAVASAPWRTMRNYCDNYDCDDSEHKHAAVLPIHYTAADAVLAALARHVTAQAEQRDAAELLALEQDAERAQRKRLRETAVRLLKRLDEKQDLLDAALAGVDTARQAFPEPHQDGSCDSCCDRCDQHRLAVHRDDTGDGWCVPCLTGAARRDALAPVLALCDQAKGSSADWFAEQMRAAVESPDQPEGDNMCPNCVTPWKCNGPHRAAVESPNRQEKSS